VGAPSPCQHSWVDTYAGEQCPAVRAGDAERHECVEALTEHHVLGRLTVEELDRRQRAALVAVTQEDLAELVADLPGGTDPWRPRAGGQDWWSLEPRERALRLARWTATPVALAAGGVLVASADVHSDGTGFAVGLAAAALGYLTHLVVGKGRGEDR
jgi:hypothetical protein